MYKQRMGKKDDRQLNDKEQVFVDEYLIDLDPDRAAIKAGYSKTVARTRAFQWVSNSEKNPKPYIRAAIKKSLDKRSKKTGLDAQWVLERLEEVAERCMDAEPVMVWKNDERVESGAFKFDSSGANKALSLIGKHLKMFTDRVEVEGTLSLEQLVTESREDKG